MARKAEGDSHREAARQQKLPGSSAQPAASGRREARGRCVKRRDASDNNERNDVVGDGEDNKLQATQGSERMDAPRGAKQSGGCKEQRKSAAEDKAWKQARVWVREVNGKAAEAGSKEVAATQRLQKP